MNVKRRRSGFTLLEILVVIGIILVLISIAVISYQVVERSAASRQTKVTLENLNSMLAELDASAGSNALPNFPYTDTSSPPITQTFIGVGSSGADGKNRTIGDVSSGGADRYGFIVQQTQAAMANLTRVPNNNKAIAALPASKILRDSNNNPIPTSSTVGPVLLDGWGNPIIYVCRGGINVLVTTGNGSTPQQITVTGRDNRPFFASAGPDGDFGAVAGTTKAAGDDNVYSKE